MSDEVAIPNEFWGRLGDLYPPNVWPLEEDAVRAILPCVLKALSPRYRVAEPIGVGGAGIVMKLLDTNLQINVALKMARPVRGRESVLNEIIASEISRLRDSSHPNIISIFYQGAAEWQGQIWPYYVMEYLNGALDAFDYVRQQHPHAPTLKSVIRQVLEGLKHLHDRKTIHGDVKLENVLVAPNGQVKLSDLGSARLLDEGPEETVLPFTVPWAHPHLTALTYETSVTDRDRARVTIRRSSLRKAFDLYALGQNLRRVLGFYDPSEVRALPPYVRAYMELMACRMLDGLNRDEECALGLPRSCFGELKYGEEDIARVVEDARKLTGEYAIHDVIPELDHHFPTTIQVSSAGSPAFTEGVAAILKSEPMKRSGVITQLGLICRVYPTARHSRLEHVLGTFANVCRYVDALWNDRINPLFRQLVSEQDVKAVLVAALCHDVGYYPSAHDFDEACEDIFSHRMLTNRIMAGELLAPGMDELFHAIQNEWQVLPSRVAEILSVSPADLDEPFVDRLLHTLIDGPIDADKLDYLVRDSVNLSVPYGHGIDLDRLLKCLTVAFRPEGDRTFVTVGIHEKGKVPAESVAFARYALFGAVYWHHTVRAMKAMLHRAIWNAIPKEQGNVDKRTSAYKAFCRSFVEFAHSALPATVTQGSLWAEQVGTALPAAPDIPPTDLRMIHWLHEKTDAEGKSLLRMICERRLFKRLLVLSSGRTQDLWHGLVELAKDASCAELINLQNEVQRGLIRVLSAQKARAETEPGRTVSALAPDVIEAVEAMDTRGDVLFLVDIPRQRPGSQVELCYLPEHRRGAPFVARSEKAGLEYSKIWADLSESLLASIGKVRVFCHPVISDTAEAGLSRGDIEGVLGTALRHVKSS